MKTPPQPKAPMTKQPKNSAKAKKPRITGRWRKIKGHRFAWRDFPAIAGSWRTSPSCGIETRYWSYSSVWQTKAWDDDRTHFLTLPNPPRFSTPRNQPSSRKK